MKKLTKKLNQTIETIEAYCNCWCSCVQCDCSAPCNQGGYSTLVSASSSIHDYNLALSITASMTGSDSYGA